jgi:hypothetical protein
MNIKACDYPILRPSSFDLELSFIDLFYFLIAALFAVGLVGTRRVNFGVALTMRAGLLIVLAMGGGFLIVLAIRDDFLVAVAECSPMTLGLALVVRSLFLAGAIILFNL